MEKKETYRLIKEALEKSFDQGFYIANLAQGSIVNTKKVKDFVIRTILEYYNFTLPTTEDERK